MAYIGNIPATQFASLDYQDLTGVTGSPSKRGFTLDNTVGSANDIEVFVNNVRQEPGVAYTVSGTTLTMTGDVETTDDFYVVFQGKSIGTASHPAGNALEATTGTFTGALTATDGTFSGGLTATAGASTNALSLQSSNFKMTDLTTNAFYRTGTWTPIFSSAGATSADVSDIFTSSSYTTQYGQYERIGDVVHAHAQLALADSVTYQNGGATNQGISVAGFPFNVKTNSNYFPMSSPFYFNVGSDDGWDRFTWAGHMLQTAKKSMTVMYAASNGHNIRVITDHIKNGTATSIIFNITYCTDDA
tara:strand:+ start:451 stop:1359 length:909 start_codon:yes stop_codon:yes gene_type:complete